MTRMATITVLDVEIRERTVDVPLQCPHCEAPLATEEYSTTVSAVSLSEVDDRGYIEVGDHLPEPTVSLQERDEDTDRGYLNIYCVKCGKSIISEPGTIRIVRPDGVAINDLAER